MTVLSITVESSRFAAARRRKTFKMKFLSTLVALAALAHVCSSFPEPGDSSSYDEGTSASASAYAHSHTLRHKVHYEKQRDSREQRHQARGNCHEKRQLDSKQRHQDRLKARECEKAERAKKQQERKQKRDQRQQSRKERRERREQELRQRRQNEKCKTVVCPDQNGQHEN